MNALRSQKIRFIVSPKKDGSGGCSIWDDNFGWDASLHITGDFGSVDEKIKFAQAICDVLNENEGRIPFCPP